MKELETNRVFDTEKIGILGSTGGNLLSTGCEACTEWDTQIGCLTRLEVMVPQEARSQALSGTLSGMPAAVKKPEYETVKQQLIHTAGKLAANMPPCDASAAGALELSGQAAQLCTIMIEELKDYIPDPAAGFVLSEYENALNHYDAKWYDIQKYMDYQMYVAGNTLSGLVDYTAYSGDPVNMATGNFIYRHTDLEIQGRDKLTFTRFYNAQDKNKGSLGRGWIHNWETRLRAVGEGKLTLVHGDGREEEFLLSGGEAPGVYKSIRGSAILRRKDFYFYQDAEKHLSAFDSQGHFVRFHSEDGCKASLCYEEDRLAEIQADTGEKFTLSYNEAGQLIKVQDHTGREILYGYEKKKLVKVTDSLGNSYTYGYGKNGRIEQIHDKRGIGILENRYDDEKRITLQKFPDGGAIRFSYQDRTGRVLVTEQNGNRIIYIHDSHGRNIETRYEDGKETRQYDGNNRCTSHTDKNGNTTVYEYDRAGRLASVTDPLSNRTVTEYDKEGRPVRNEYAGGRVVLREYDRAGRLCCLTDPGDHKIRYQYRGEGRFPVKILLPDGSSMDLEYDRRGNLSAVGYPDGTGMSYRYDRLNRVIESRDGNGNRTRFAYDALDRITEVTRADGARRSYRYNEMGEALSVTDFDGQTSAWEYNGLNRPAAYTDKCGRTTHLAYDIMWNLTRVTDPEGGVTDYVYNRQNRLAEVTGPGRQTVRFTYDAKGNRTGVGYPDGTEMQYGYDALDRCVSVTDQRGNTTRTFYDAAGNVCRTVDAAGNETVYEYDRTGNRIRETDAAGGTRVYTYTPLGKEETATDPEGKVRRHLYGPGGRLLKTENGDGTWEAYGYDGAGNITSRSRQDGTILSYRYDCLNRVTEVWRGGIREKAYEYDPMGNVLAATDAAGNRTEYRYTPSGMLAGVKDPLGNQALYTYNGRDEIISIRRLSGEEEPGEEAPAGDRDLAEIRELNRKNRPSCLTLFERNAAGQVEKVTDEEGKVTRYRYDAMGRVISVTDGEGRETACSYHPDGRLAEARYPDGKSVALSYDALGRLEQIKDWLGETVFAYDGMGRMVSSTDHRGERTEYGWNPDGTRKSIKYPDGREVLYGYDGGRRLTEIRSGSFAVRRGYNEKGQLSHTGRGNGVESIYRYDGAGRVAGIEHRGGEGIREVFAYGYDILGNCIRETRQSGEAGYSYDRTYTYDALSRLGEVREGDRLLRRYGYDAYGNRTGEGEPRETAEERENGPDYILNCLGQLESIRRGEGEILQENTYNGLGCRVGIKTVNPEGGKDAFPSETTTRQYMDYTDEYRHVVMESVGGESGGREKVRRYLWQGDTLLGMPGEDSYVLADALHTPVCVADREGRLQNIYRYSEYGELQECREEEGLPFGYTGYRRESLPGLYHAGAREYDSREGRFLTRDAFRYLDYRDPAGWNLFLYGKGNPLRYRDPSGHECVEERGYWERTANHVVKGDFTEDVTLAGIGIDVVMGLVNFDLPMDVRDIAATFTVNFAPGEFSWWVTAFANIVAVLPFIGAVKYLDDIAAWAKNMWKGFTKNVDTFVDVYKHSDGFLDGIGAGLKAVWRNQDEVTKLLEETLEAGQKRLDDLKELEKLADSGEDLLGDLGGSGKYWDDVVEGGSDVVTGIKLPQGISSETFSDASKLIKDNIGDISDDIVVQGSRASGTAKPTSDIDIAVRVTPEKFDELIQKSFGTPNSGTAKERTMLHAIETGKIQAGEAGLRGLRKELEKIFGMEVDISIIEIDGPFDNPPFIPIE